MTRPRREWKQAAMEIRFTTSKGNLQKRLEIPAQQTSAERPWYSASLAIDPITFSLIETPSVKVSASESSRFSFFQASADTYASSREHKMATGNETGLLKEWETQWGQNAICQPPTEWSGLIPWASIHESSPKETSNAGAQASRALVLRSWKARLGGKEAAPWISERGVTLGGSQFSNLNLTPPPSLNRLEPGDFLEATLEYIVLPQFAADYYGSNQSLRNALEKDENTWRMAHREAHETDRHVHVQQGTLLRLHPTITIYSPDGSADFTLKGGLGYVPVTFTGLPSSTGRVLLVDNQPLQQTVHGNDFWQTDFDPNSKTWSQTFNIPINDRGTHAIRLLPLQKISRENFPRN